MKLFYVTYVDLYLSEVGDGDPDLQFTPQEEYVMHQRCLGRWKAKDENDLKDKIFDFIGYPVEDIKYQIRKTYCGPLKCNPNEHSNQMKTVTEKRYFVTTKFEKYGTYTIMARSKEHAIQMWKDGDWNFDNYESDYGEYNEVIDEVEEEVFADTQLSLEGVF